MWTRDKINVEIGLCIVLFILITAAGRKVSIKHRFLLRFLAKNTKQSSSISYIVIVYVIVTNKFNHTHTLNTRPDGELAGNNKQKLTFRYTYSTFLLDFLAN